MANSRCRPMRCRPLCLWVSMELPQVNKAAHERRSASIEIVIGAIKVRVPGGTDGRDVEAQQLRRYWTNACRDCALKPRCTTGKERRITRWEYEHVLEAVQKRLDRNPQAMRQRRETVEHPFGTLKMRMGATHFLMKRLPKVATEMALHVLAYNLTRVMNIIGIQPLMTAIRA